MLSRPELKKLGPVGKEVQKMAHYEVVIPAKNSESGKNNVPGSVRNKQNAVRFRTIMDILVF
jgi:hypothetical protein